jgi:hypothetical protein
LFTDFAVITKRMFLHFRVFKIGIFFWRILCKTVNKMGDFLTSIFSFVYKSRIGEN